MTVVRADDHVIYARVSDNGTAGLVDARCLAFDGGTRVPVTYDVTATGRAGLAWLQHRGAGFDGKLLEWRNLTLPLVTGRAADEKAFEGRPQWAQTVDSTALPHERSSR